MALWSFTETTLNGGEGEGKVMVRSRCILCAFFCARDNSYVLRCIWCIMYFKQKETNSSELVFCYVITLVGTLNVGY